eukprot:jgi/Mesvir1/645/Mv17257-RA.1
MATPTALVPCRRTGLLVGPSAAHPNTLPIVARRPQRPLSSSFRPPLPKLLHKPQSFHTLRGVDSRRSSGPCVQAALAGDASCANAKPTKLGGERLPLSAMLTGGELFLSDAYNWFFATFLDFIEPILLRVMGNIFGVVIRDEDRKMLKSLRDKRLLYYSNHPSVAEPPVALRVAHAMGVHFKYQCARQVFSWHNGFVGRTFRWLGVFSVLPGAVDISSAKYARDVLAMPRGRLAVFPEGEPTTNTNDMLVPFQPGLGRLAFWALTQAQQRQGEQEDLTVLPAFVKYVLMGTPQEIDAKLRESMAVFAGMVKITVDTAKGDLVKLCLKFAHATLQWEAEQLGLSKDAFLKAGDKDDDPAAINAAINAMRSYLLDRLAERLLAYEGGAKGAWFRYEANKPTLERTRQLLLALDNLEYDRNTKGPAMTESELDKERGALYRAYAVATLNTDYICKGKPSLECCVEWMMSLERFVKGDSWFFRPRIAHVLFGKPFALSEYMAEYGTDKKSATARLDARLQKEIQDLCDQGKALNHAIPS